jgi:hypothetical protein
MHYNVRSAIKSIKRAFSNNAHELSESAMANLCTHWLSQHYSTLTAIAEAQLEYHENPLATSAEPDVALTLQLVRVLLSINKPFVDPVHTRCPHTFEHHPGIACCT